MHLANKIQQTSLDLSERPLDASIYGSSVCNTVYTGIIRTPYLSILLFDYQIFKELQAKETNVLYSCLIKRITIPRLLFIKAVVVFNPFLRGYFHVQKSNLLQL